MMFRDLVYTLTQEYRRRTGAYPPDERYLWEPWVGEFLRTYAPPRAARENREAPHGD